MSIDDDIARAIESLRQRKNLTLRQAINQLLRTGLRALEMKPASRPYQGPVFDSDLRPGIDPNRLNQLADELEMEGLEP